MPKKRTIAEQLAARLGGQWQAIRDGFGWYYSNGQGRQVRTYSESILDYDGYSDTEFKTVYVDNHGVYVGVNGWIYHQEI